MAGEQTKARILQAIAGSRSYVKLARALYEVDRSVIHVRYKSRSSRDAAYPYNISRTTLGADYELWICGDADGWYFIPMAVIRKIYDDPQGYVDRRHPNLRVVTVDASTHKVTYGSGGRSVSVAAYRNAVLS